MSYIHSKGEEKNPFVVDEIAVRGHRGREGVDEGGGGLAVAGDQGVTEFHCVIEFSPSIDRSLRRTWASASLT